MRLRDIGACYSRVKLRINFYWYAFNFTFNAVCDQFYDAELFMLVMDKNTYFQFSQLLRRPEIYANDSP